MLSDVQQSEFRDAGFVRLPGAIPEADTRSMREQLWAELARVHGLHADRPDTWRVARPTGLQRISRSDAFAALACPAVQEACDQILGPCRPKPFAQPLVVLPRDATGSCPVGPPSTGWHTDLPAPPGDRPPGIRIFTFLDAVLRSGGGTAVVAGSHRVARALAAERGAPLPSRRVRETLRRRSEWMRMLFDAAGDPAARARALEGADARVEGIPVRAAELTGDAGDVLLMDLNLLHAAGQNGSDKPRLVLGQVAFPDGPAPS